MVDKKKRKSPDGCLILSRYYTPEDLPKSNNASMTAAIPDKIG